MLLSVFLTFFSLSLDLYMLVDLLLTKQPGEDMRLQGFSLIEPCAIVPGAERNLESM